LDPGSGRYYYYNAKTKESTWTRPVLPAASNPFPFSVEFNGSWSNASAGGCHPNFPSWRYNPQYFLGLQDPTVQTECRVLVSLERKSHLQLSDDEAPAIGFYVFKHDVGSRHKLYVTDPDHIARSEFVSFTITSCEFKIEAPSSQYVIIPCTFHPGYIGEFSLRIVSQRALSLRPLADSECWAESTVLGEWKEKTAGGCRNHQTWQNNPQYLFLVPPSCPKGHDMVIVLSQNSNVPELQAIGFYIINKVGDIVGKAAFMHAPEVYCALPLNPDAAPYLVVPCTFAPGRELPFRLSAYTPKDVHGQLVTTD